MLSNGELNHLPMKERMTEIGSRWQRLPLKDKDRYKKIAEEKQRQYKVQLEQWLAVSIGNIRFKGAELGVDGNVVCNVVICFHLFTELVLPREKYLQRI